MKTFLRRTGYALLASVGLLVILILTSYHGDIPVAELEPKYLTPESSYIELNDAQIHVRQRGSGRPVILLHGSFASLHTWNEWENELSLHYRTISVDLPGHGLTGPSRSGRYSSSDYAVLVSQLLDKLELDSVYLIGNSMGGGVALRVAARYPQKVAALVLVDSSGPSLQSGSAPTNSQKRPLIFRLLSIHWLANGMTIITPKWHFKWNMKQVYADPNRIEAATVDRYYDLMLREGNRQATLDRLQQMRNCTLPADSLRFVHAPTLILWGERDKWIPLSYGEQLHSAINGSTLVKLPDLGHVPMEENPDVSLKPVVSFLLEQPR
ncbi:MAG: alpha/beta fold hydrolase [Cyclobacteriaceae bacterium]